MNATNFRSTEGKITKAKFMQMVARARSVRSHIYSDPQRVVLQFNTEYFCDFTMDPGTFDGEVLEKVIVWLKENVTQDIMVDWFGLRLRLSTMRPEMEVRDEEYAR